MAKPIVVHELLEGAAVQEAVAALEAVASSIADERVAKEEFIQAIVKRLRAA